MWKKVKQSHYRPGEVYRVPEGRGSQISRQLAHESCKVVSRTHRSSLPPGNIPGTHFCKVLGQPQGQSAAGRIMSMKHSSDTIGNRTRDRPTYSAVPQPNAPARAPNTLSIKVKNKSITNRQCIQCVPWAWWTPANFEHSVAAWSVTSEDRLTAQLEGSYVLLTANKLS